MFEKLQLKLASLFGKRAEFDPSRFGDPLAGQIEWTPASGGGANFRTHKLVTISTERVEFHATAGARAFYSVFLVAGLGVAVGIAAFHIYHGTLSFCVEIVAPFLFGTVFAAIGGGLLRYGTRPIVFDKQIGCFWKGRKSPQEVFDRSSLKYYAELDQIHALQILSEYCSGKSSYYSYELNLVLNDGNRINVVDHGNLKKLREDAMTLSEFLGKPVWDAA